MSMYRDLTAEFNTGRTRCIISSGRTVVMHRLAVMSTDGNWIIKEDDEMVSAARALLPTRVQGAPEP